MNNTDLNFPDAIERFTRFAEKVAGDDPEKYAVTLTMTHQIKLMQRSDCLRAGNQELRMNDLLHELLETVLVNYKKPEERTRILNQLSKKILNAKDGSIYQIYSVGI